MKNINHLNRIIEYSFYLLFLLVPLVFSGATSELFEFPKMWLTFGITILIGATWFTKMILQRQFRIQRTPLDIPIVLFLTSQIISTFFSLDPHVSLWGYYSRFNGGLLSVISYLLLFYALVSNFSIKQVLNLLKISLFSGLLVALWGLPSHFGVDPTCYIFRGSFDTSCWTEAFKPTIRIFSTLGQPAWLAAYMSVLIPISIAFATQKTLKTQQNGKSDSQKLRSSEQLPNRVFRVFWKKPTFFFILALLFYAGLVYTDTRGGFIGFWIANIIFWGGLFLLSFRAKRSAVDRVSPKALAVAQESQATKPALSNSLHSPSGSVGLTMRYFLIFNLSFLIFNFLQGVPISQLSKFTLPEISKKTSNINSASHQNAPAAGALGGTDSGKIRLLVWEGAINAWVHHPIIGTGVETFAFAYYKYRPVAHNLTSEWDYLYNKAHNEYLNYLTTSGIFGLGSYLLMIGFFVFRTSKWLMANSKLTKNNEQNHMPYAISNKLIAGLLAGYISILVSNFFGFSVVIINLYFFLIPAFVFVLGGFINDENVLVFPSRKSVVSSQKSAVTKSQWVLLAVLLLTSYFLLQSLLNYLRADTSYSTGSNLANGGGIQEAYPHLVKATSLKENEPVYKDELSINMGTLAAALYLQKDASSGAKLAGQALALDDNVVATHPNNVVFWKNRVRLLYTLAKGDPAHEKTYLKEALTSIKKAQSLAPTDAKVSYNLGVMVGQTGDLNRAIQVLENTIKLKPDYRDAYFALGLFYNELATDANGNVLDSALQKKATESMEYILKNIDPQDKQAKETLVEWK